MLTSATWCVFIQNIDPRIRREVVAQMLDYAANCVQYWPIDTLRGWFKETCQRLQSEPDIRLAEVIGTGAAIKDEAAIAEFWQRFKRTCVPESSD
jgi:hypothetical protein